MVRRMRKQCIPGRIANKLRPGARLILIQQFIEDCIIAALTVLIDNKLMLGYTSVFECPAKGFRPRLHISYITQPKLQTSLAVEYFL